MYAPSNQAMNPTDDLRHEMLRASLKKAGRPEDYDYILKLLNPPPDITNYAAPGSLKGVKVGIIGGGLAGMASAFELRKLGADITILEASQDRIGGRVYTYYFDPEGMYYGEFGAHRIPVSHETTWHYINLFGLDTISLTPANRNNFLYVHNTRLRTTDSVQEILYPKYDLTPQERNTPWPELSDYAFHYPFLQLTPEIRAEMISILPEYSPEYITLMSKSLRQNFEALGLSQGAINLISGVNPSSGALLNISYDEIATEDYTFDYINTYRVQGGMSNLPIAIYQSFFDESPPQCKDYSPELLGTVTFKTGHYVTGIYQSNYRNKVVIKYHNQMEGKDTAEIFDYVICAIPFTALREVEIKPYFNNMKMQAILELNYIDSQKTLFYCNRRFWEKNADYGNMVGGISFTDLPIQSIFYPGDHLLCSDETACSPDEPGVLEASYNNHQNSVRVGNMEKAMLYNLVRQNVEEVHGLPRGYLNSIVQSFKSVDWNSEPNFRGGFHLDLPGQKKLFAYEMQQPEYNNRVFFAGEHTSTKHGWMQGALYSGKFAANNLAYYYNQMK